MNDARWVTGIVIAGLLFWSLLYGAWLAALAH